MLLQEWVFRGFKRVEWLCPWSRNHPCLCPNSLQCRQENNDPNIVQQALTQAAGGIGDLDQAQNYEQVMNTMRGDQATVGKDDRN